MPTHCTQAAVNKAWGEPVVYTRSGIGSTHTICAARYLRGEDEVRSSYGVYSVKRERYTLADDALPFDPKLRDTITPAGKPARVVTSVDGSPWLKFWILDCQYPSLADDLDSTADVKRPSTAPSSLGLRVPTFSTVYSSVACRLQPDERVREFDDATAKVLTRKKFVCIFGSAVLLLAGDKVTVGGVDYEVTEQSEIESLGLLTFCACERID